jgi:hypothetical protein
VRLLPSLFLIIFCSPNRRAQTSPTRRTRPTRPSSTGSSTSCLPPLSPFLSTD